MKSFLVHIASLAVMVHMTFGCNMHHGLGSANACGNQNAMPTCCSSADDGHVDDGHDDDGHDHNSHDSGDHESQLPESVSTFDTEKSSHGHNHLYCQNDGCNAIKLVKFDFVPLDFSTAYLGGAEDAAIANTLSHNGNTAGPFPDDNCVAPKMRTHLSLGVLLI